MKQKLLYSLKLEKCTSTVKGVVPNVHKPCCECGCHSQGPLSVCSHMLLLIIREFACARDSRSYLGSGDGEESFNVFEKLLLVR